MLPSCGTQLLLADPDKRNFVKKGEDAHHLSRLYGCLRRSRVPKESEQSVDKCRGSSTDHGECHMLSAWAYPSQDTQEMLLKVSGDTNLPSEALNLFEDPHQMRVTEHLLL